MIMKSPVSFLSYNPQPHSCQVSTVFFHRPAAANNNNNNKEEKEKEKEKREGNHTTTNRENRSFYVVHRCVCMCVCVCCIVAWLDFGLLDIMSR